MRGGKLNKATQPFERVNIVFKGPLPSNRGNIYWPSLMNIHFLPDFACREKLPTTCLSKLFYIFGMSSYIYCDRGPSFKFCVKIYFKRKEYLLVDILRTTHGETERNSAANVQLKLEIERFICAWMVNHFTRIVLLMNRCFLIRENLHPEDLFFFLVDDSWESSHEKLRAEQVLTCMCSWSDSGEYRLHTS